MQVPNKYFRASMVYMMTNMEVMNEVIAFNRDKNGILTYSGSYPTYGRGAGPRKVLTCNTKQWRRSSYVTRLTIVVQLWPFSICS